ncbi:MAG: aminoglycoside phosphotransferase family protein [Propionibacteriaceae bacterium]|nr:aminoglycoside phosphotransferase family protein [Propionibacteriaceae bacterium]
MVAQQMMHQDEIPVSGELVARLIALQHPEFAGLPLRRVKSTGTVNAIFRLGDQYCVRLPRLPWAGQALRTEWDVLSVVAPHVTLAVPEVVAMGTPDEGYPLPWAVYRWIPGRPWDDSPVDERENTQALAGFVTQLHAIPVVGNPPPAGRQPLAEVDQMTIEAIKACGDDIDVEAVLRVWRDAVEGEPWDGERVWIHADLLKPNLIIDGGQLTAIIDFGSAGVGDPAFDVIPAWAVLTRETRDWFRELLKVDDAIWHRARGYALHQAALITPYYRHSNPAFAEQAKQTIANLLT